MLFLLREEGGFEGRMVGVDYSAASVELCRRIAAEKGVGALSATAAVATADDDDDGEEGGGERKNGGIEFAEWDVLRSPPRSSWIDPGFDVVLDKGTFDAVSLSAETDEAGRRACEGYRGKVVGLVRVGGWLVVTSCNWTEEELMVWFEGRGRDDGEGRLERCGRVEYPVFRFGGMQGQSVHSVVFRRSR